jgi:hypothetical protein
MNEKHEYVRSDRQANENALFIDADYTGPDAPQYPCIIVHSSLTEVYMADGELTIAVFVPLNAPVNLKVNGHLISKNSLQNGST